MLHRASRYIEPDTFSLSLFLSLPLSLSLSLSDFGSAIVRKTVRGDTSRAFPTFLDRSPRKSLRRIDEDLSTLDGPRTAEKLARNGVIVEPGSTWKRKRRYVDHGQRHHEEPLLEEPACLCHQEATLGGIR